MTTTVRSVRVELEASIAGYVRDMRLAGSETDRAFSGIEVRIGGVDRSVGSLEKSTSGLSRTSAEARIQQTQLARGIDDTGRSAGRAGPSIDRYSGRLKTILGLVQILGPAALRLGLGSLPAVSAGLAGLGAGAGGIGVTALAVSGLGDAFKALNDYELERTPENLQKVRLEMERLGPDGAHFVQFLDDISPRLRQLQLLARAGVLPGFEEGIDSLLDRLPLVRQIVGSLSQEVGDLSADAGESLASDKWTPFFEYVRSSAAPILDDFARSPGNVALALPNILVEFDPLTQNFTSGLERMTQRFADWSENLEDDEGFQAFLDEVRDAGPDVLAFLGSAVDLMGGLAHASAPVAATVLPALTATANILAAIANSPVGPTIYTVAAAWLFYSRAAGAANKATTSIQTAWEGMSRGQKVGRAAAGIGLLAAALTDYDEKAGLANTTTFGLGAALAGGGPIGISAGVAIGLITDIAQANDDLTESIQNAQIAIDSGDTTQMQTQLRNLRQEIQETEEDASLSQGGLRGLGLSGGINKLGALWSKYGGELTNAREKESDVEAAIEETGAAAAENLPILGGLASNLGQVAGEAEAASQALSELHGWFDQRDAVRAYKDALGSLREGLKDGFTREDAANLDDVGESLLRVAELIESPTRKAAFLAEARSVLDGIAGNSGPRAAAAVQDVIDKFDSEGFTSPPVPKVSIDARQASEAIDLVGRNMFTLDKTRAEPTITADGGKADRTISGVEGNLISLGRKTANPKVAVDPGNSFSILGGVESRLSRLVTRTWTATVNVVAGAIPHFASGGYTGDGGKHEPAGVVHRGEFVVDAERTKRDRGMLEARYGRLPGYAGGGMVEDRVSTYTTRRTAPPVATNGYEAVWSLADAADGAARGLKGLEKAAGKVEKAYDRQQSKLEDLISQRDSLASSIASSYLHDPFGNGLAGFDAQLDADSGDIQAMTEALATLVRNGLSPKSALYQALAASADVNTAQQLAQLSSGELASRAQRFEQTQSTAAAFGGAVAGEQFNQAINRQSKVTEQLERRLHSLEDAIRDFRQHARKDVRDGAAEGAEWGAERGSEKGTRAGNGDRTRRTAAARRAGG